MRANELWKLGVAERIGWKRRQIEECPRCDYCDAPVTMRTATVDHIIPLCSIVTTADHRKATSRNNWALACEACNKRKGGRTLADAGMRLLRKRK